METQKPNYCQPINEDFSAECTQGYIPQHYFKDGKYYREGKYFGDVTHWDDKVIKVECKNGNLYMQGHILEMHIPTY